MCIGEREAIRYSLSIFLVQGDRVQGLLNVSDLCPRETDEFFNAYRVDVC